MTNDLVPHEAQPSVLDKINIPRFIAGPAGEAISRLIGGAADIPAAWLESMAQGIRDKKEAKTVVSKAVANAAADLVKSAPELGQRAAQSLIFKELRRQTTKETIAAKTIQIIVDETPEGNKFIRRHRDGSQIRENDFERLAQGNCIRHTVRKEGSRNALAESSCCDNSVTLHKVQSAPPRQGRRLDVGRYWGQGGRARHMCKMSRMTLSDRADEEKGREWFGTFRVARRRRR